ncbi:hypothetical protein [Compostimonas suwonensis]|uniref:AMP-binding enzyme n=1 Tax=Compostimonas suwonensis TaxID=1048394 RepID=A0A2M9BZV0_9MICO|nr:hypothetical protein [Compostimonas suwonensis]PJJ63596.1 hypothetical protein CLV54_1266 [Compostimonas suwonensis]
MSDTVSENTRERLAELTRSDGDTQWIDTATSPRMLDELGRDIAELLREHEPDAIICWLSEDEVLIAHAVALALSLPVSRADDDLGLLSLRPALEPTATRVAMIATSWTRYVPVGRLFSLLRTQQKTVVGIVSLLPGERRPDLIPTDIPYLTLGES